MGKYYSSHPRLVCFPGAMPVLVVMSGRTALGHDWMLLKCFYDKLYGGIHEDITKSIGIFCGAGTAGGNSM